MSCNSVKFVQPQDTFQFSRIFIAIYKLNDIVINHTSTIFACSRIGKKLNWFLFILNFPSFWNLAILFEKQTFVKMEWVPFLSFQLHYVAPCFICKDSNMYICTIYIVYHIVVWRRPYFGAAPIYYLSYWNSPCSHTQWIIILQYTSPSTNISMD